MARTPATANRAGSNALGSNAEGRRQPLYSRIAWLLLLLLALFPILAASLDLVADAGAGISG